MSFKGLRKTLSYLFLNSNFCLIFNPKYIIIIKHKEKRNRKDENVYYLRRGILFTPKRF